PVGVLTTLQVAPFHGLLRTYPDAWWRLIEQVSAQVLVEKWSSTDWAVVLVDAAILILSARTLYRGARPSLQPALIVSCAFMLLSLVGSLLLHNQLLTQIQLWRALWIPHALALACLPALLLAMARSSLAGLASAASLACIVGVASLHAPGAWVLAGWVLLHL